MDFTPKLYLVCVLGVLLAVGEAAGMSNHASYVARPAIRTGQADTVIIPAVQRGTPPA